MVGGIPTTTTIGNGTPNGPNGGTQGPNGLSGGSHVSARGTNGGTASNCTTPTTAKAAKAAKTTTTTVPCVPSVGTGGSVANGQSSVAGGDTQTSVELQDATLARAAQSTSSQRSSRSIAIWILLAGAVTAFVATTVWGLTKRATP